MKIGFIGLGMMGSGVCMNIATKGYETTVFDMNEKALAPFRDKATIASSAEEAFLASDMTFLSLPGSIQVEELAERFLALDVAGKTIVDLSTSYPLSSRTLHEKFKARGCAFADASLTGTPGHAQSGELIVTFGGDRETFERCGEVAACFARSFQYIGDSGAGNIAKLVNNYLAIMYVALYGEIFPLAEKLGIDVGNLFEIIGESGVGCRMYQGAGGKIVRQSYEQGFALNLALKDIGYVKRLFEDYGSPSFILDGGLNAFRSAKARGLGPKDVSEVAKVQREFLDLGN